MADPSSTIDVLSKVASIVYIGGSLVGLYVLVKVSPIIAKLEEWGRRLDNLEKDLKQIGKELGEHVSQPHHIGTKFALETIDIQFRDVNREIDRLRDKGRD